MLFNVVANMLAMIIASAKEDGLLGGIIPHLVEGEDGILHYANNIILFMEQVVEKAVNMKLILYMFEHLSIQKINFHKIKIFCFRKA
jgi:hypothetical protein